MVLPPRHFAARSTVGWLILLVSWSASGAQAAPPSAPSRVYYDYAPVVSVTEIHRSHTGGAQVVGCRVATDARDESRAAGNTGTAAAATQSIASAILRDFQAGAACEAAAPVSTPIGYEVRYRYGDQVYQRVMTHPPGERIRVRVQLAPNPG
jgi:uncharacterized protein YcfJ